MAWSSTPISATVQALRAANKPWLAANVIASPSTAKWTETGTVAATDRTLSTAPASRAYDGLPGLQTQADTTAASTWYFVLDLGQLRSFDCIAIMGGTVSSSSLTGAVVEVADNSTFTTNRTQVADLSTTVVSSSSTEKSSAVYCTVSGVVSLVIAQYVRLKLTKGSNFTPKLGELLLLQTRQLKTNPNNPWDPNATHGESDVTTTSGGVTYRTRHYALQRRISAQIVTHETAYQNDLVQWHEQVTTGNGTFVWCDQPDNAPERYQLMIRDDDSFSFPTSEYTTRTLQLEALEQGPELYFGARFAY